MFEKELVNQVFKPEYSYLERIQKIKELRNISLYEARRYYRQLRQKYKLQAHTKEKRDRLTEEDKAFIISTFQNNSISKGAQINIICNKYGVCPRTASNWRRYFVTQNQDNPYPLVVLNADEAIKIKQRYTTLVQAKIPETYIEQIIADEFHIPKQDVKKYIREQELASYNTKDKDVDVIIATWALQESVIHKQFFQNLCKYADHLNAKLIVNYQPAPVRIQSPYSKQQKQYTQNLLLPYVKNHRQQYFNNTTLLFDVQQPLTMIRPLNSLHFFTTDNIILGFPQLHMQNHVTVKLTNAIRCTTGSVTLPLYRDTRLHLLAELKHKYGAVIIEYDKKNNNTYIRQIEATEDDGSFCDLCYTVNQNKVIKSDKHVDAIVIGDLHPFTVDNNILEHTLFLIQSLNIKKIIIHEAFDGYTINYHDLNNHFEQFQKRNVSLKDEIDKTIHILNQFVNTKKEIYIIESNHDHFIEKWLIKSNWYEDMKNAELFLKLALQKLQQNNHYSNLFEQLLQEFFSDKIKYIRRRQSFQIHDWELSIHGDYPGTFSKTLSTNTLATFNDKIITAHTHQPYRTNNIICVGTCSQIFTPQNYFKHLSHTAHAHALIYNNTKAQLLIYNNHNITTIL